MGAWPFIVLAGAGASAGSWKAWIASIPLARSSLVVEVGANDHSPDNRDPALEAVRAGWGALLLEPLPSTYAKLEQRYRDNANVRTLNALVCSPKPPAREIECLPPGSHRTFFSIDTTNARGTHGSPTADTRCLEGLFGAKSPDWVTQLSSLTADHLLKHARIFGGRPRQCSECAERLGKPGALHGNCMRDLVRLNMVQTNVTCACLASELRAEVNVTLLVVDAEGQDEEVLLQYPFARLPPDALVYESIHLSPEAADRLAGWLESRGYVCAENNCRTKAEHTFWLRREGRPVGSGGLASGRGLARGRGLADDRSSA
jgi:hypothetical protein